MNFNLGDNQNMNDFNDGTFEEKPHDYWLSYSDMMAALIMMFMLLLLLLVFIYTDMMKTAIKENEDVTNELKQSESRLEEIIGIRKQIIQDLKRIFENTDLQISIDPQTGAITFSSSILFAYDSAKVSKEGKDFLREFFPKYISVLLSEENRDKISQIIVEGHTDDSGSYLYNLDLSQRRALAVAVYVLSDEFPEFEGKELLKQYITSNGRSFSNPIKNNGIIDAEASRRVEFKFRLNEEEMVQEMELILQEKGGN